MPELKASEALAQHRNIIFRKALEKLKNNEALNEDELTEVQRRETEETKKRERVKKEPKVKRGRPTKLTPDIMARICKEVSEGATYEEAATLNGISPKRISDWKAKGQEDGGIFEDFSDELAASEKRYIQKNRILLNRAAEKGNWQAALTILERKDAANWGRRDKLEHSGPNGTPLNQTNVAILYLPDNGRALPTEQPAIEVNGNGNGHAILLENGNGASNGNGH